MQTRVTTAGPFGSAVANSIALSQTLGAAGPLTLNGTLAIASQGPYNGGTSVTYVSVQIAFLSPPQRVTVHSAGNDSAATITIVGTSFDGAATISETLAGGNVGTVTSVLDYATVTSISFSAATAAAVTAGNAGSGSAAWIFLDSWANSIVGAQVNVTGTVNYQILASYDDPNSYGNPVLPASMYWDNSIFSPVPAGTANASAFAYPAPLWVRLNMVSGSGSARLTLNQTGNTPL
jgi:hypothetical protein